MDDNPYQSPAAPLAKRRIRHSRWWHVLWLASGLLTGALIGWLLTPSRFLP